MQFRSLMTILIISVMTVTNACAEKPEDVLKKLATTFIEGADAQKGSMLQEVLHPQGQQFVKLGGKLSIITAEQYIQLIDGKKLGGTPRKITFGKVQLLTDNLGLVDLSAVSSEYNFKYQLSLAKNEAGEWTIVNIMADINEA